MSMFEEQPEQIPVRGKTVKEAVWNKTLGGYPFVEIEFTDGTFLRIEEQGQTGWITHEVGKGK